MSHFLVKVTVFLMVFLIGTLGCQVSNSNSGDEFKYGEGALGTLQSQCGSCHSFASDGSEKLIADGLVVGGDPDSSTLFKRIKGSGFAEGDMPPSGELSEEELQQVREWIEGL